MVDVVKWAKSNYKLLIIIGVYLTIRISLINVYKAFWWDEAQYVLMTKHLFKNTPTTGWWEGRSMVLPVMYRILMPFYSEIFVKLINILFGLGFVVASFFLIKKVYGEEKAFLVSLIMCFQWVFLFWSLRITIGIPSAFFLTLSGYFFLSKKKKDKIISGILLGIAASIRYTALISFGIYLIYDLIKKRNPLYWILGSVIGLIPIIIDINSAITFISFNTKSSGGAQAGGPLYYLETLFFNYGVLMGLLCVVGFVLMLTKFKKNLFFLLNIVIYIFAYSVFTSVKEVRFLIHLLPFIGLTTIAGARLTRKKEIVYLIVALICIENVVSWSNVFRASYSYYEIRLAGEFLKEQPGDLIMCNSVPQLTYYSEKEVHSFPENKTKFLNEVMNYSYVVVSIFEKHPEYAYKLNESFLKLIAKSPRVVIYKVLK